MTAFFPDPDDSLEVAKCTKLTDTQLEVLLENYPAFLDALGRRVIQIDCMRFLVDDIAVMGFTGRRWTNGSVFYRFDRSISGTNKARWLAAAEEWSQVTNLHFIERTTQKNYIYVISGTGNQSYVGMIGGRQDMIISSWHRKYIICHEIGHALGLSHEHSRSDRDTYVKINHENVIEGREQAFERRFSTNYTSYDFCSVMHYGQYAFSKNNLPTIEAQDGFEHYEECMGNRRYLTSRDAAGMGQRYGSPMIHEMIG